MSFIPPKTIHFVKKLFKLYFKSNLCWYILNISPSLSWRKEIFCVCIRCPLKALIHSFAFSFPSWMMFFSGCISTPGGKNKRQTLYYEFLYVFLYCYVFYREGRRRDVFLKGVEWKFRLDQINLFNNEQMICFGSFQVSDCFSSKVKFRFSTCLCWAFTTFWI